MKVNVYGYETDLQDYNGICEACLIKLRYNAPDVVLRDYRRGLLNLSQALEQANLLGGFFEINEQFVNNNFERKQIIDYAYHLKSIEANYNLK